MRGMANHCKYKCEVSGEMFPLSKVFPLRMVRPTTIELLKKSYPEIDLNGYICYDELHKIRVDYIEAILREDKGALTHLDSEVLESLESEDLLSENVNKKFERKLKFGEKVADKVAAFGGSWKFILSFLAIIIFWMGINVFCFTNGGFDPYPFILLNLVLSCLAAIQAPVIMMSQNRQYAKDKLLMNEEYVTNLKAELEVQQLHAKLDLFMKRQWDTLLEIQKIQLEISEDIFRHHKKS